MRLLAVILLSSASWAVLGCGHSQPSAVELHTVDWDEVRLPGAICGATKAIQLRDGTADVRSTRWPPYRQVTVDAHWDRAVYGDLDGDGEDEAAIGVSCNNGSGTASGALAYARVIFTGARGSPRVVGVITPQREAPRGREYPTLLLTTIRTGGVIAHESWYRHPDIGPCCPSGRATTSWSYRDGELRAAGTVLQSPRRP